MTTSVDAVPGTHGGGAKRGSSARRRLHAGAARGRRLAGRHLQPDDEVGRRQRGLQHEEPSHVSLRVVQEDRSNGTTRRSVAAIVPNSASRVRLETSALLISSSVRYRSASPAGCRREPWIIACVFYPCGKVPAAWGPAWPAQSLQALAASVAGCEVNHELVVCILKA